MIKTIIFDFDGVLFESVNIKTEAFAELFVDYGKDIVDKVVSYHLSHGGVSRFDKFKYYYKNYLKKELSESQLKELCKKFSDSIMEKVLKAPWVKGAKEFLEEYNSQYVFFIVSATPEPEILQIVEGKGIGVFFEKVYGSPLGKKQIIANILKDYKLVSGEVAYIGDSISDMKAAIESQLLFVGRVDSSGYNPFKNAKFPLIYDLCDLERRIAEFNKKKQQKQIDKFNL